MNSSSANSFHAETIPNRMTPIQSNSPSTLKLGDPISENFASVKNSANSSTPTVSSGNPNYILYAIIVVLLAILGLNVFAYLGMLSDTFIGFFRPILAEVAYLGSETAKNTINTSAEGSKLGIDVAAGTLTSAIDLGQKAAAMSEDDVEESVIDDHKLKQAINDSKIKKNQQQNQHNSQQKSIEPVIPDNVDSLTQQSKPAKKAGFCYIGEDRGFRSCIKVSEQDTCMSGNIFPSQDICINPNLREGSED
jgi:hypothetical protein